MIDLPDDRVAEADLIVRAGRAGAEIVDVHTRTPGVRLTTAMIFSVRGLAEITPPPAQRCVGKPALAVMLRRKTAA